MARPRGHQTMNPKTIRAMVKGPHCGLIIAVFIFTFSQSRTIGMWPRSLPGQCNAGPILALEIGNAVHYRRRPKSPRKGQKSEPPEARRAAISPPAGARCGSIRWSGCAGWRSPARPSGVLFVDFGLGFPLPLIECLGADRALGRLQSLAHLPLRPRPPPQHRLRLGAARLRLRPARRPPGADRRAREPVLAAAARAGLGLGHDAAAALDLPSRRPRRRHRLASLSIFHLPLPWDPARRIVFDDVYVIGIWVSLVCGVVFISAYTNRVAHEARQLADALAATELALSRHEQLSRARWPRRRRRARARHAALDHRPRRQGDARPSCRPVPLARGRRAHHLAVGPLPRDPRKAPQPRRRRRRPLRRGAAARRCSPKSQSRTKGRARPSPSTATAAPAGAGDPPQRRPALRPRQPHRERRRSSPAPPWSIATSWDRDRCRRHHHRRRPGLCARADRPARRALPHDPRSATPRRRCRRSPAASVSASSSPRPCWSAPAPHLTFANAAADGAAPGSRSSGRAPPSKSRPLHKL